jgi:hypothetical protein
LITDKEKSVNGLRKGVFIGQWLKNGIAQQLPVDMSRLMLVQNLSLLVIELTLNGPAPCIEDYK